VNGSHYSAGVENLQIFLNYKLLICDNNSFFDLPLHVSMRKIVAFILITQINKIELNLWISLLQKSNLRFRNIRQVSHAGFTHKQYSLPFLKNIITETDVTAAFYTLLSKENCASVSS